MTVTTNGYTLSTTAYTRIATTSYGRVRVVVDNNKQPIRVVSSVSAPDADTDDYFPVQAGSIFSIEGLGGGSVWALANPEPSGAAYTQKVRVIVDHTLDTLVTRPLF